MDFFSDFRNGRQFFGRPAAGLFYTRALLKFSLAKTAKDLYFVLAFYEIHFSDVYYQKSKSDTNKHSQYKIEREGRFSYDICPSVNYKGDFPHERGVWGSSPQKNLQIMERLCVI